MSNGEDMFGGPSAAELGSDYRRLQQQYGEAAQSNQERFLAAMERLRAERTGPSTAEKLFAISSALSRPTRTGKFIETLGNVGSVMSEQEKAARQAQMERAAMLEKYEIGQGAASLEALKTQLDSAGQMYRATKTAEAAQARAGRPIFRGTEKLNDGTIVAIYEDPATSDLTKRPIGQGEQQLMPTTMLSDGQPVLRKGDALFLADGTPVTQIDKPERKLSPTEMNLVDDTTKRLTAGKEGLISLDRAIELNSTAYEGSLSGVRKMLGSVFSSDDPAFVATELLDKTIIGSALAQMKTIFGANPTEGERKILLDIQGSSDKTRAVREKIFQDARAAAQRRLEADAKTLGDIRSGSFGRVQPAVPSPPGKPRVTNWRE
jgi:hypothetical protein